MEPGGTGASEILEAEGHLVDSGLLPDIFDRVIAAGARFEVLHFELGATNDDYSRVRLKITASEADALADLVEALVSLGCHPVHDDDAIFRAADQDGCAPDDFYSTSNLRTSVRVRGEWLPVHDQRMDAVIVLEDGARACCRKLRQIRRGDLVACGLQGIRVMPEFRPRDRLGFAFMTNEISSERRVESAVGRIASMMRDVKGRGGRIAFVVGPVVIHTGGGPYLSELIREGFVDAMLAGNALAVHDVEAVLFGTSLGVSLETGTAIEGGHRHHMRAINTIRRAGGLKEAVAQGLLQSGVMYECVRRGIPYVLAGSIRDDGPLPETVMDLFDAQEQYARLLAGVDLVVVLSTMLHGIGVGNMLPAWVRMVCVDINPAVITKLADRGSSQTIGVVTDSGLFLHQLARQIGG